jgi:hypothetical protein
MKKLADIKLVDENAGVPKGRFFQIGKKLYKILGFDVDVPEGEEVRVHAVRILRSTMRTSRKQPIFEVFKFSQTTDYNI